MDTEPGTIPQGVDESACVVSSGVCGESGGHAVIVDDIDDLDALHADALDHDKLEDYEANRFYQRDMSYARAALRRGALVERHVKSRRRERRSRATRTAKVASTSSGGDSSPPPSSDPPAQSFRALAPHLTGGA